MLYEMLTGQHPSRGDDVSGTLTREIEARHPGPLQPAVTTSARQLVERLLRRDPAQRYQGADELLGDLTSLRTLGRRTQLALGSVVAALVASLLGVVWWRQIASDRDGAATSESGVSLDFHPFDGERGLSVAARVWFGGAVFR